MKEDTGMTAATAARRFISTTEAGKLLGVGRVRAWQLCVDGTLPAIQVGRRYLVDVAALDSLSQSAARKAKRGVQR